MKIALKNNQTTKLFKGKVLEYNTLLSFIQAEFNFKPQDYTLTFKDQDGDTITISSNDDLNTAIEINTDKILLKITITKVENTNQDSVEIEQLKQEQVISEPQPQEKKQNNQVQGKRHHHWNKWGHKNHHHRSHSKKQGEISSSSGERGHWRRRKFERIQHFLNESISSLVDERVKTLIPCLKTQLQGGNPIKLFSVENPLIHNDTECKSCFATPIVGIRYKCFRCPNFNLCQSCEPLIDHQHNLLKIKKPITEEQNKSCFPFFLKKMFKQNCHGSSSSKQGKESFFFQKKCRKLSKIFGGEPEQYKQFVTDNMELRPRQTIQKFAEDNKIEGEQLKKKMTAFKCQKLGHWFEKQPEQFKKFVEENIDLRPRQMMKKLVESGMELKNKSCGKWNQQRCHQKRKFRCSKSKENGKQCNQQAEMKTERGCHQKSNRRHWGWGRKNHGSPNRFDCKRNSAEKAEKGKIMQTLVDLFGSQNIREYFKLIEQHFSLGQQAIIQKWLQTQCQKQVQ